MKKIIIAIDGESSSGKSTLAKALAKKLSYKHINTGSMYRAVTFVALKEGLVCESKMDSERIIKLTQKLNFDFRLLNNNSHLFLNGVNIEKEIKLPSTSNFVSQISTISEVRKKIVEIQRGMGLMKGVVMEGRDIGSVVFPSAEAKFFITADINIRARRRFEELRINNKYITSKSVLENLKKRDFMDKNRKHSKLERQPDSVYINTAKLNKNRVLKFMEKIVEKKL